MNNTGSSKTSKKVLIKAYLQLIFGWMITTFSALMILVGIILIKNTDSMDGIILIIFGVLFVFGIRLTAKAIQKIKLVKKFHGYSAILDNNSETSLDILASSVGISVMKINKEIKDMIFLGLFPDAYVDNNNRLILGTKAVQQDNKEQPSASSEEKKLVTVQCKGCGATNKIMIGAVGECEFCGSQISEN